MANPGHPAVLTIAGSDSGGGAGIQADLKTFTALGCYGTSVLTALTAQNTLGVQAIHPVPPEFVSQQIRSVLQDIEIHALKTGMLLDVDNVRAVVAALKAHYAEGNPMPPLVCDPVCVSTSGHTLLQPDAIDALITDVFPIATLITPNKSEAEFLLSHRGFPADIRNFEDMLPAARNLATLGPSAVLLKGGHITATLEEVERFNKVHPEIEIFRDALWNHNTEILQVNEETSLGQRQLVADLLYELDGRASLHIRQRIESSSTHGTGCTLSAAIVSALARGQNLRDATETAGSYTHQGIENAFPIGKGHGPLNHLHPLVERQIPRPTASNPHPFTRLLIRGTEKVWKEYVEHDFVKLLGKGTLPRESFLHFIRQDHIYLKYYGRAYGLLAAKSTSYASIASAATVMLHVVRESEMHRSFCAKWGITETELDKTPESSATSAYGAYLLDAGLRGDSMTLILALLACLLGYGEVGLWLKKESTKEGTWMQVDGNPYQKWIDDYSGEDYQNAVKTGLETIEARAAADPPSPARLEEWKEVWERCTRLEKNFWDMAIDLS
ncbi:hypothetical protein PLICRDRAFT_160775 [Plicaturopsis crispa FD-325 SS-3]|nr:hypothetical protein PLICRDRAFT_160775 [Plicaturopsis crispa FD-325 SS-3]